MRSRNIEIYIQDIAYICFHMKSLSAHLLSSYVLRLMLCRDRKISFSEHLEYETDVASGNTDCPSSKANRNRSKNKQRDMIS